MTTHGRSVPNTTRGGPASAEPPRVVDQLLVFGRQAPLTSDARFAPSAQRPFGGRGGGSGGRPFPVHLMFTPLDPPPQSRLASSVIVVPVSALLTGQPFFAA